MVTGAGSGIGRAIALRLAAEGAHIAIADVDEKGATDTASEICAAGRVALVLPADVANSSDVRRAVAGALARFGRIHVLINNAGINIARPVEEFGDDDWRRITGINLDGVWFFCRYTIPHMVEQGGGAIVNVASVGAFQASHNRAPYMATKGAVVSLTQALALDFADRNIRVNAVAPGVIETAMGARWRAEAANRRSVTFLTPMGRFGRPEEIAAAAAFLASADASFITGETLVADGGLLAGNRFGRQDLWQDLAAGSS